MTNTRSVGRPKPRCRAAEVERARLTALRALMAKHANWEPYDANWLVELAREQLPEQIWLPGALAACASIDTNSRPRRPDAGVAI